MALFKDRSEAGKELAKRLDAYSGKKDTIVLALPRGGVPVAYEVARALHLPMDIIIVRKLGVPGNRELAMGAIASGGIRIINYDIVRLLNISQFAIDAVSQEEQEELERREKSYRGGWPPLDLDGRTVILVDDGIATGATIRAAVEALKRRGARRIVVAVPTASTDACNVLRDEVDDLICLTTPDPFIAVGRWYEDFSQTSDEEVSNLLAKAAQNQCAATAQRDRIH